MFEQVISASGQKYNVDLSGNRSLTSFDIVNDTQWKIGVSFDHDNGYQACDIFVLPLSFIPRVEPLGKNFSVGQSSYGGKIFIYSQSVQGGTPITTPPAQEVVIMGYPKGDKTPINVPMNRVNNIGGSVNATVTTLANNSNTTPTLIINIGESGSNYIVINSDGSASWAVLQGGVLHIVFTINASGTALQLGQSSDFIEILGSLLIDSHFKSDGQLISSDGLGNFLFSNNKNVQWKDSGGTSRNTIFLDTNDQLQISGNSGPGSGHGAVVINSDTNAVWKIRQGGQGPQLLSGSLQFINGSVSSQNGGIVSCGSGTTISHGVGSTPAVLQLTPVITQPGSGTTGVGNIGPSTFQGTIGAGSQASFLGVVG